MPLFTIVIPTKARPELIDYALFSLHNQSFDDFSVVITDDYDDLPCEHVVRKYNDKRFKYIVPPKELKLGMCGNWEYGLKFADGEYVIFIQDKMFMYQQSLEYLANFIKGKKSPDIISWSWDFFAFDNDSEKKSGILSQRCWTATYKKWNINDLVEEKLSFSNFSYQNKTGAPGAGSPLCSAIKRRLYDTIKEKYGIVFDFINPDYGPPIRLLDVASDVYELDDHLTVAMPVKKSEGLIHSTSHAAALSFLEKSPCGAERLRYALIPELKSTNSNMISADYNYSLQTSCRFKDKSPCDFFNTLGSIAADLRVINYESEIEQKNERELFIRYLEKLPKDKQQIILKKLNDVNTVSIRTDAVRRLYRYLVPMTLRLFINRLRNAEYRSRRFKDPAQSFKSCNSCIYSQNCK